MPRDFRIPSGRLRFAVRRGRRERWSRGPSEDGPGRAPGRSASNSNSALHGRRSRSTRFRRTGASRSFTAQDFVLIARSARRSLGLSESELGALAHRIAAEGADTERLLKDVARELGTELHVRLTTPRATDGSLGLPPEVSACLFDLDGLLSGTSAIHAAAWREAFDTFLAGRLERTGERFAPFRPFDPRDDYYRYLHGRPRLTGRAGVPREPRNPNQRRAARRPRRRRAPCSGSATEKTRSCSDASNRRACRRSPGHCNIWRPPGRPV